MDIVKEKILKPYLIDFEHVGNGSEGYISIAQFEDSIPFEVKRIFWTYYTPQSITRGRHAHHITEMILIATAGNIEVELEDSKGSKTNFVLDNPEKGLYIPPYYWHIMKYSHNAVQLVLASTEYEASDYIRDYEEFKNLGQ